MSDELASFNRFLQGLLGILFLLVTSGVHGAVGVESGISDDLTRGRSLGDTQAPVTITEYGGLGCYLCNQYYRSVFPELLPYIREGSVQYRYKHYPLSGDGLDLDLNQAAECTARQDQFWSFRNEWVTGGYARSDTGLATLIQTYPFDDWETFRRCINGDESSEAVLSERSDAMEEGVSRIPHVTVGSETIAGVRHPDVFRRVLHEKLNRPWKPEIRTPEDSPLTVTNLKLDTDTDHQVQATFYYEYDGDTDRRTRLKLGPADRNSTHFHASTEQVVTTSGTASLTLTYGSHNPQHEIQSLRTRNLKIYVADREDEEYVQFHYPKKWRLHRFHPPSDTIPDDPDANSIGNVRVSKKSPTEYVVTFDYTYRSDHGPRVFAGGSVLRDGHDASYSYRPQEIERGTGTATVEIGRRESSVGENPRTDQIQLEFYVGGERDFYKKTLDRDLVWGSDGGGEKSDRSREKLADQPGGNLGFMRELFKRYRRPDDVPDSFVETYFNRGGREDFVWLFNRILDQFQPQLQHNERGYQLALRTLETINRTNGSAANVRSLLGQLFAGEGYREPLYEGRFSRGTFERIRRLFHEANWENKLRKLRVPNVVRFDPENPTWQFPVAQLDKPIFVAFPRNYYVEYVDVARPLNTLSEKDYSRAYRQLVSERGQYVLYEPYPTSGDPLPMNSYFTQDYSVDLESEARWLALDFHQAEGVSYNLSVYVQAFEKPHVGSPSVSSSRSTVGLDDSSWSQELRTLEWMWTTQNWKTPEVLEELDPDNSSNMPSILRMIVNQQRNRRGAFLRSKNKIDSPLTARDVKVLQRYRSLALPFLSDQEAYEYHERTDQQKLAAFQAVEERNPIVDYEQARLEWVLGKFETAARHFRDLEESVPSSHVLWPDIRFYRISSLYRARRAEKARDLLRQYLAGTGGSSGRLPAPDRETFTEVEGIFTQGKPRRNYLRKWLRVMQEGKRSWWYKQLGVAEDPIRYFRFFASGHTEEPIGKLVTNAFRANARAPIAYMNHKGMRGGIPDGPIRRNELLMVLPWNNSVKLVPGHPPESDANRIIEQYLSDLPYPPSDLGGRGSDAVISSGSIGKGEIQQLLRDRNGDTETFAAMVMPDYVFRRSGGAGTPHRQSVRTDREMLEWYIEKETPVSREDWN